ncbi:ABC transporter permease [Mariniblastus sp.]|nr:ABC transporter permease [Mariniblastus sp.]
MPIHDVGYRSWEGTKTSPWFRWMIISKTGIRLAMKSAWVRRIMFAAWLPLMYWSVGFFMIEKSLEKDTSLLGPVLEQQLKSAPRFGPVNKLNNFASKISAGDSPEGQLAVEKMLRNGVFKYFPHSEQLAEAYKSNDVHRIRKEVWRWLLMVFFRYPQSVAIMFLIGMVAPSLIAQDIRSRAFLMYFSRPIGKLEYIFGKLMVPSVFIASIITLPALAMYVFAVFMSPDFSVLYSTWDIPIRILIASVVVIVPTALLALALSSMTQESRFANFSWFAVWVLGHGTYLAVMFATAIGMNTNPMSLKVTENGLVQSCSHLSLYNCLGKVQEMVFGFASFEDTWRSAAILLILSAASMYFLYQRVSQSTQQ